MPSYAYAGRLCPSPSLQQLCASTPTGLSPSSSKRERARMESENGELPARSEADRTSVVSGHHPVRGWDWHELRCVLAFLLKAVLEAVWGLLTWIFQRRRLAETPDLHFIDTAVNRCFTRGAASCTWC